MKNTERPKTDKQYDHQYLRESINERNHRRVHSQKKYTEEKRQKKKKKNLCPSNINQDRGLK